jgi:hypothetical protein
LSVSLLKDHHEPQNYDMEITKTLEIIKSLSQGVDPYTGEIYPSDSPYQHPDTTRALLEAIHALERMLERSKRQGSLPESAGKAWSTEEDSLLIEQFDKRIPIKELSVDHKRTEGAIKSRLLKLGKISLIDMTE